MDRPAARIVRALAPKPEPHPLAADFAADPLLGEIAAAYGAARLDWQRARTALAKAGRQARKLGSKRRRFHGDLLHSLVRHDRTLSLLLERAGLGTPSRDRILRAHVTAALVALHGLEPPKHDGVDWRDVADPGHTLLGWVLETDPSPATALGAAGSLPDWIAAALLRNHELKDAVALVQALNSRAALTLRVNGDREAFIAELAELGIEAVPTQHATHGVQLSGHRDTNTLPGAKQGRFDVQDEGSQLIAELVAARPGETIVDACAGAGGKALALGASMQNRGSLLLCDVRRDALEQASQRARRAGLTNLRAHVLGEPPRVQADAVLVDAPCSGSGALRRRPQNRWLANPLDLVNLPKTQLGILRRFAPLVKPGGRLVYATCSLFAEENEAVRDAFLAEHPGFRPAPLGPILGEERAETLGASACLNLRPHRHGTDGFFACVLHRESE